MIEPYQFDARDRDAVYKIDTQIAIDAGCVFHQSRSFAVTTQWAIPKEAIVERRDLRTAGLMWENPTIVRQRENILATAYTLPTPPSRPPPKAMPTAPMPTRPVPKPGAGRVAPKSEPPAAKRQRTGQVAPPSGPPPLIGPLPMINEIGPMREPGFPRDVSWDELFPRTTPLSPAAKSQAPDSGNAARPISFSGTSLIPALSISQEPTIPMAPQDQPLVEAPLPKSKMPPPRMEIRSKAPPPKAPEFRDDGSEII